MSTFSFHCTKCTNCRCSVRALRPRRAWCSDQPLIATTDLCLNVWVTWSFNAKQWLVTAGVYGFDRKEVVASVVTMWVVCRWCIVTNRCRRDADVLFEFFCDCIKLLWRWKGGIWHWCGFWTAEDAIWKYAHLWSAKMALNVGDILF